MPSAASKKPKPGDYPTFDDTESITAYLNSAPTKETARKGKKGRNATSNQSHIFEESSPEEIAEERPVSSARPQSILGQIPRAFGRHDTPLDAFDTPDAPEKVSDQFSSRTEAWTRDVPFGKSPPGESLVGDIVSESPPVAPGYLGRGGFSRKSPPVSPRQGQARPVSFGSTIPPLPNRQSLNEHLYPSQTSAYGSPPAPPHLPQSHFYNAQDVDLGLGSAAAGSISGEISFVALTPSLIGIGDLSRKSSQTILLGSEGRLDVLSVQSTKPEQIGALYGLPGTVVDAVILTCRSQQDGFADYRPLVAVILHGPKLSEEEELIANASDDDMPRSFVRGAPTQIGVRQPTEYQTRAEVYSLAKRSHIVTLLKMPPVAAESMYGGKFYAAPSPTGGLKLGAAGNYLTVASGSSGEIFAFGISDQTNFECIGKFWTTIQPQMQRRDSSHGRSQDPDVSPADLNRRSGNDVPILALNGRWLAICPASSFNRQPCMASLGPAIVQTRLAGLDLRNAPPRPPVTCDVDSPDADTLLGKVVRGVTKQAVKGAGWVLDQSVQAFNSYWRKDLPSNLSPQNALGPLIYSPQNTPAQFPPTHGAETQATREPDLVSIFDLKALQQLPAKKKREDSKPIATFQPPGGCSYLSFMPNGLGLLTASRKGDSHYAWDLMQIKHHRTAAVVVEANIVATSSTAPRVRQIAKFPRFTPSSVVDVIWSSAVGDQFVVVTKNGTVHLYDLQASTFRWPPPRPSKKSRPTSAPVDPSIMLEGVDPPPSGGFFASAMNIAGKAQPMLANLRGRAPSFGGGLANTGMGLASATGVNTGRAVAAGLSKSLGAATGTVNQIRHAGESRIHLKSLMIDPSPGRVAWDIFASKPALVVVDKSTLRRYLVVKTQDREKRQLRISVFGGSKLPGYKLPDLSSLAKRASESQRQARETSQEDLIPLPGFWKSRTMGLPSATKMIHPLSYAEIDSNAPYQPFHSDPRVSLSVYPEGKDLDETRLFTASMMFNPRQQQESEADGQISTPFIFGAEIPAIKLNLNAHQNHDDADAERGSIIYRETTASPIKGGGEDDMVEQIVTTTRRKKARRVDSSHLEMREDLDQEGFFEDDMDVLDFAHDRV